MLLTIVTINYNNVVGLRKTFESVLGQSFLDFQYIVIDGGSTDGSKELIASKADRIDYWVSETDRGIYNAMNKGITVAQGDYTIFMNSGDAFYDSDVLKNIVNELDGTDVVYGNTLYTNGERRFSLRTISFKNLYAGSFSHQSTFIKTCLLKKYPYDEKLKIVSDWKFFLQTLIIDNGSYRGIDLYVSLYDAGGISSLNLDRFESERIKVLQDMFPKRILDDMHSYLYGDNWEDKLYLEIKHSSFHKLLYTLNICIIRMMTFFRRGSSWIKKYPRKL